MRRFAAAAAIFVLLIALLPKPSPARAATLIVNTLADLNTGSCAASCSLRDAIAAAVNSDTITFSVSGTIHLSSGIIINKNITIDGANPTLLALDGGGAVELLITSPGSTVNVANLTLQNAKSYSGSAVYNNGALTITGSAFTGNTALFSGGAIYNSGTLTITGSTFAANSAVYGGAISNAAILTIRNSTFSGNSVTAGAYAHINNTAMLTPFPSTPGGTPTLNNSVGDGGALLNDLQATATISNSTFAANSATHYGGGIFTYGTLHLKSSIIAGNTGIYHPADLIGQVDSQGSNLIGDMTEAAGFLSSDQLHIDPLLSPLALNAPGSTQTMALQAGSPAISKGDCSAVTVDQRGIARKSPCDVGAYEVDTVNTPTATSTLTSTATLTLTTTLTSTPSTTVTLTSTPSATPGPRIDTIGIYRNHTFYLRYSNSTGIADRVILFGGGAAYPITGNWSGSGIDSIGIYDQSSGVFYLRDTNTPGAPDHQFTLGNPGDMPIAGRWANDMAHDGVGVFRPSNGILYLKKTLVTGVADYAMVLGNPGDVGIAGDWNGDGIDSPGVYRPTNSVFYLTDRVQNGIVYGDYALVLGRPNDMPITGDWTGIGHSGVGVFRPTNGVIYLKNALTSGVADNNFVYGIANDIPVAGHWQTGVFPPGNGLFPTSTARSSVTRTPTPVGTGGNFD